MGGGLSGCLDAWRCGLLLALCLLTRAACAFEHDHAAWSGLLRAHVQWTAAGTATTVDYAGLARDRVALGRYLASLSALPLAEFDSWNRAQQRAFLINAYNAWTVELILGAEPGLASIRELGSLFSSPWKKRFFQLFGQPESLDGIEHERLRGAADFDEPRIHFAVNCASVGCPALRPEAYRGDDLDAQLEDQTRRFLRDRTRNRWDRAEGTLYLSRIFDWYAEDFVLEFRGGRSLGEFLAQHADELGMTADEAAALAAGELEIDFLDYDWSLNAAKAAAGAQQ